MNFFSRTLLNFIIILFPLCILVSCNNGKYLSDEQKFQVALQYAGKNSRELERVIQYYSKKPNDSLKLKAAYFLINNMIGKGYYSYTEIDNKGLCSYNLFNKNIGIDSINILKKRYQDSTRNGKIIFVNPVFKADTKNIKSPQIIENIEYAFKAWELPWAKKLTFDQFKELILPYRIGDEPLQNWRKDFFDNRKWIIDKIGKTNDRVRIAGIINDSLKKSYHYGNDALSYFPGTFTLNQLKAAKAGRCNDLDMVAGYWLRAIGIPTAAEITPYWANSNHGGHSWLSVLDNDGKFVPMNAVYDNPVRDSLPFKDAFIAKAYRNKYELKPDFYNTKKYVTNSYDITKEYLPTVNYKMKPTIVVGSNIYIGVLNGTYWKPLKTQIITKGDSIIFMNLGRNVLYAPIIVLKNGKTKTIGSPFFVYNDGKIHQFIEDKKKLTNVSFNVSSLEKKLYRKKCQVVYWNNGIQNWVATGDVKLLTSDPKKTAMKIGITTITFNGLVSNAIYRVFDSKTNPTGTSYGRPFIYNEELRQFIDY